MIFLRESGDFLTEIEQKEAAKREEIRLKRQFSKIDKKAKAVIAGLIERAAFMRIQLDILEDDIAENGTVEMFSQSENQEPYPRKRPQADLYNSLNTNYQKIIKQLCDLLPKEEKKSDSGKADPFLSFITGREDL